MSGILFFIFASCHPLSKEKKKKKKKKPIKWAQNHITNDTQIYEYIDCPLSSLKLMDMLTTSQFIQAPSTLYSLPLQKDAYTDNKI